MAVMLLCASALSVTARTPSVWAYGQSQSPVPATERIKRLEAQLDQVGRDLERALIEVEHERNSGKLKDEKIKALEEKVQIATDLASLYKATAEAYKQAAQERATANTIDDERVLLYEKRIKLYDDSQKAYEAEVVKLRKQRGLKFKIGTALFAVGLGLGAAIAIAVTSGKQ